MIFHSRDIRKCEKEFQKLFDLELKAKFYEELNKIISYSPYTIIASAIQKDRFIEQFGKLQDDVYEVALSFVIEQAIMVLKRKDKETTLSIIIEKRGKGEDKQLDDHFQRISGKGTGRHGRLSGQKRAKVAHAFQCGIDCRIYRQSSLLLGITQRKEEHLFFADCKDAAIESIT